MALDSSHWMRKRLDGMAFHLGLHRTLSLDRWAATIGQQPSAEFVFQR
jgi:hypothetical protein